MRTYCNELAEVLLGPRLGQPFKSSALKKEDGLRFTATNLHVGTLAVLDVESDLCVSGKRMLLLSAEERLVKVWAIRAGRGQGREGNGDIFPRAYCACRHTRVWLRVRFVCAWPCTPHAQVPAQYSFVTAGAPSAHSLKYKGNLGTGSLLHALQSKVRWCQDVSLWLGGGACGTGHPSRCSPAVVWPF